MNTKGDESGMVDSVAISYAWIDDAYKERVIGFVNYLRENGYDAVMDELLKQRETAIDFNEMMAKMIPNAQKVIVFLSPKYKERADGFVGGVGLEYRILLNEISRVPDKYIFVTFENLSDIQPNDLLPNGLGSREIIEIDISSREWEESLFAKLSGTPIYRFEEVKGIKRIPEARVIKFKNLNGSVLCKKEIIAKVKLILAENKQLLLQFGPNSLIAVNSPMSDTVETWEKIKRTILIPNNDKIIELFEKNYCEFTVKERECFEKFKLHACAFALNQEQRMEMDAVPCFPKDFERMIEESFND